MFCCISPAQRPLHARVGCAALLCRPLARQTQVLLQAAVGVQRRGGRAGGGRACGGAALMLQGDGLGPLPHPAALSAGSSRRPGFVRPPAPPSPQSPPLTAVTTRSPEPTAGHIPAPGRGARYGPAPEAGRPPRPISARVPEAPPQTRPQHLRSTGSAPSIPSVNNSHLGEGRNKLKLRVIFQGRANLQGLAMFTKRIRASLDSPAGASQLSSAYELRQALSQWPEWGGCKGGRQGVLEGASSI